MLFQSLALLGGAAVSAAVPPNSPQEGVITVNGQTFQTWAEYTSSPTFRAQGLRCHTPERDPLVISPPSDCSGNSTNPSIIYDATSVRRVQVVVHVITSTGGSGNITDNKVFSQIDILNEDFKAIAGSNGANGFNSGIEFYLATEDPNGNPTNGITRSANTTWYNDGGSYWNSLNWDPDRYLNIYTNQASGALGYVPFIPQTGNPGANNDRVVVLWSSFGLNAPIGPPYNKGRTTTHEVGHYLGLYHTFDGGCGTAACYSTGDLICDTNRESGPNFSCGGNPSSSCSSTDPDDNYMNYSDDLCMERFTEEQSRRMRCTMEFYRPDIYTEAGAVSNYCNLSPNSVGPGSTISFAGSTSVADQNMSFIASGVPPQSFGIFYFGPNQIAAPFGNGTRCVGGATTRIQPVVTSNVSGVATRFVNWGAGYAPVLEALGGASMATNVQYWFRDGAGGGDGFNLSNGLHLPLAP